MVSEASKWLWQRSTIEKGFQAYNLSYQVAFASKETLSADHLRSAVQHLFRKVPPLRACYGQREGSNWLGEMEKEIIDFEVVKDATKDEVNEIVLNHEYNETTGPLWCVKLLPGGTSDETPGFPFVNTVFIGLDHGFTDGYTNMKVCGFLTLLLNDVMAGKSINDEEQLGVYVSSERTQKLVEEQITVMKNDASLKEKLLNDLEHVSLFYGLLPEKEGERRAKTRTLTWEVDAVSSSAFSGRCRAEGVTMNSAFTALGNVVMVEILEEGGIHQDMYNICSNHAINSRRFWEDGADYLGCHALPFNLVTVLTPRDAKGNFWEYARTVHREFRATLETKKALQIEALKEICRLENPDSGAMALQNQFDFCVTNMGDVTPLVTQGGDHAQVTHVVRCTALHKVPNRWVLYLHSFRGRMINLTGYSTAYITDEMAHKFSDGILQLLKKVIV